MCIMEIYFILQTVRVIANLCLSETVGKSLAASHSERTIRALLACLDVAETSIDNHVNINLI